MARNNIGALKYIVHTASRLPAYLSVPLAGASFVGLRIYVDHASDLRHHVAGMAPDAALTKTILYGVAVFAEFAVPAFLLMGAAVWTKGFLEKRRLKSLTRKSADPAVMNDVSPDDFERVVGQAFAHRGYVVELTPSGADGGIDLVMSKNGNTYFVQCKRWRVNQVGVDVVRSLFGVMQKRRHEGINVAGAYVVTSGTFTRDARQFVKGLNIWLLNGEELRGVITEGAKAENTGRLILQPDRFFDPKRVHCPDCGSEMVIRRASKGIHEGKRFYGCSDYPGCLATVPID